MVLNYISSSAWWDTDRTVLPLIHKKYEIRLFGLDQRDDDQLNKNEYPPFEKWCNKIDLMRQRRRGRSLLTLVYTFLYCLKIFKIIRNRNVINLYVIGANNLYFALILYFILPKSRTTILIHNFVEHLDMRKSLFSKVKSMYYKRFRFFCFFSEIQCKDFLNFYNKRAYTLPMPLKDFGLPQNTLVNTKHTLLCFGNIRDYKGLDVLIKSMNMAKPDNIQVVVAGRCKNWDKYYNIIEEKDKYQINIGLVPDNKIPDYFCNSDFIVLPYRDATQSGPSLIALNYGIPIIASDLPIFKQLISDKKNGFLFEKDDVHALADILLYINKMSKDEINCMKKKQFKRKALYNSVDLLSTVDTMVNEMIYKSN